MIRNSKTPVSHSSIMPATPSTSRDHDAVSDRRGAVDRSSASVGTPLGQFRDSRNWLSDVPTGAASDLRGAVDLGLSASGSGLINNEAVSGLRETMNQEAALNGETVSDSDVTMDHDEAMEESRTHIAMDTIDRGALQEKMNDSQLKFERACQQIVLLDQKIKDLEVRYKQAVKRKQNSFRYNLRLKLSVFTGIKMMYHHYAGTKADELTHLHRQRHSSTRETTASRDTRQTS